MNLAEKYKSYLNEGRNDYIVLGDQSSDEYFIVEDSWFEWVDSVDTYSDYGQPISAHDAGSILVSSISNYNEWIGNLDSLHKAIYDNLGDNTSLDEDELEEYFDTYGEEYDSSDWDIEHDRYYAYTFWDGRNYKSIVLKTESGIPVENFNYFEVSSRIEKDILKDLEWAKKNSDWEEYRGYKELRGQEYVFTDSNFQDDWSLYTVNEIREY